MLLEELHPLLQYLNAHPHAGYIATFTISFVESLMIIGFFIPGLILMPALGTLIGSHILPLWPTLFCAMLGAILGDNISYAIGKLFHERVQNFWPLSKFPQIFIKGQHFFQIHGRKSVLLGRFIGPVRPIVPLMAGMMSMPYQRFLLTDTIAAVLWAPAYMLPGFLLGMISLILPPEFTPRFVLIAILFIIILWLLHWFIKQGFALSVSIWHSFTNKIYFLTQHYIPQTLLGEDIHNEQQQFTRLMNFLLLGLLFLCLAFYIKTHYSADLAINNAIFHLMRASRVTLLDQVTIVICLLGQKQIILPVFVVGFAWLIYQRQWRLAAYWLILAIITAGSASVMKHAVASLRPQSLITDNDSFSFPSGHTTLSLMFVGIMYHLNVARFSVQQRYWWRALAVLAVILVGFSRLYQGAHWVTDIIGSVLLSSSCLNFILFLLARKPQRYHLRSFNIIIFSVFILFAAGYYLLNHDSLEKTSAPQWQTNTLSYQEWWTQGKTVPIFRHDRLGMRAELINIEWLGNLVTLSHQLIKQGWQIPPAYTFNVFLHRLSMPLYSYRLPYFLPVYDDKPPVLILIHQNPQQQPPSVLFLWQADWQITNHSQTLYFGTLYEQIKHHGMHWFSKKNISHPQPVAEELIPYLKNQQYRKIQYFWQNTHSSTANAASVLLIRSK